MPKVNRVVARKDYPEHGVKKGDLHYTWSLKTGPRSSRTYRQIAPPRRSQLTTSEYLGALYEWEDSLAAAEDLEAIRPLVDDIRTLGEEQREKFDNMPEGLQMGETGQMIEARAEACDAAADQLEEILDEFDCGPDEGDDPEEWMDTLLDRAKETTVEA